MCPGIQMQYPVLYEESMNTVRSSASRRRFLQSGSRGYW